MNFSDIRSKIRAIFLSVAGFVTFLLLIRIVLDFLKIQKGNFLVDLVFSITDLLISPFFGSVRLLNNSLTQVVNLDVVFALIFYILFFIALVEVVTAFVYPTIKDIFINIVDGIFKVVEFLIFLRIIFNFFNLTANVVLPELVRSVYLLTNWTSGILPNIPISGFGFLDTSAILVLVIVIIIDVFTERFLEYIFDLFNDNNNSSTIKKEVKVVKKQASSDNTTNTTPLAQNITINIPSNTNASNVRPQYIPVPVPVVVSNQKNDKTKIISKI